MGFRSTRFTLAAESSERRTWPQTGMNRSVDVLPGRRINKDDREAAPAENAFL